MIMTICVITPKRLKVVLLEVNLNNSKIMLKRWEGFCTDRGENKDA